MLMHCFSVFLPGYATTIQVKLFYSFSWFSFLTCCKTIWEMLEIKDNLFIKQVLKSKKRRQYGTSITAGVVKTSNLSIRKKVGSYFAKYWPALLLLRIFFCNKRRRVDKTHYFSWVFSIAAKERKGNILHVLRITFREWMRSYFMYIKMKAGTNFHYQLEGFKSTYTFPTKNESGAALD